MNKSRVDLGVKEWQVVEIPLDAFDLTGPIELIRFNGNLEGTFYIDDLRLVAASLPPVTAVQQEPVRPRFFALEQNFPNPFNSGTAIRFALAADDEVELALYNLAGQKVATLIDGAREAGTYTVSWDGRDDRGGDLGSGVYLYRLQAGAQAQTRKLLLMR